MRLRQVALAATALEPVRTQLFTLLGLTEDFKDPGVGEFGLENSVMAIGDTFLEIVAPVEDGTAAGRTLDRRRADSCGYMALFQVDDFASFDTHLDELGVRKVWQADRPEVSACHVHPKDIGAAIVSFDEMRPPEDWTWGGPNWRQHRATRAAAITGCTLYSPDPEQLARRWADVLQVPISTGEATFRLTCEDTTVDIREGAYEGLRGIELTSIQAQDLETTARELGLYTDGQIELGEFAIRVVNP